MQVTKIQVIHKSHGMDMVVLETDLPSPIPALDSSPNNLLFYAAKDYGEEYVAAQWPDVPVTVIDDKKGLAKGQ